MRASSSSAPRNRWRGRTSESAEAPRQRVPQQQSPTTAEAAKKTGPTSQEKDGEKLDSDMPPASDLTPEQMRLHLQEEIKKAEAAKQALMDYQSDPNLLESVNANIAQLKRRITECLPLSAQVTSVSKCIERRSTAIQNMEEEIESLQKQLLAAKLDLANLEEQKGDLLEKEAASLPAGPAEYNYVIYEKDPEQLKQIQQLQGVITVLLREKELSPQAQAEIQQLAPSMMLPQKPTVAGKNPIRDPLFAAASGGLPPGSSFVPSQFGPAARAASTVRSSPLGPFDEEVHPITEANNSEHSKEQSSPLGDAATQQLDT